MSKTVKCSNCGREIDLSTALYEEVKEELSSNLSDKVAARTQTLSAEVSELTTILNETAGQLASYKANELQLKNRLESITDEIEFKVQERLGTELSKAKETLGISSALQIKERDTIIHQLSEQLTIAKQKAEQGSMQLQGEAQELLIEEYLKETFPFDDISEVKKGAFGADCIQKINTRVHTNCGSIYYESKRTKEFSRQWITKLKEDLISCGANVGVLITSTMPRELSHFSQINGIWVCSIGEFKALSYVLREMVIDVHTAYAFQENKGDKMETLYNYLTSNEFKMTVEGIVNGFIQMSEDLESEKRSMNLIWKKREKQIQMVLNNTIGMYGSLKGIAGSAIADIDKLQLPLTED